MVTVSIEGYEYRVHGNYDDCYEAAVILHKCNTFLMEFLRHLRRKYTKHEAGRPRESALRILRNYNPERLIESIADGKNTAYTINKGERMHMCVRNAENGGLHELEVCKFIVLHELAHIGNKLWGHNPDYWETFKWVLHESRNSGIYEPINFARNPTTWCSMKINYNPYFDPNVASIWEIAA